MDESDMLAAFHAGFALGRHGRVYAEIEPISRRTIGSSFGRWYAQYDPADRSCGAEHTT
ncbi:MAG: hypothetical protein ABEJ23_06630 [Haloarculaceae archaeon]